METSRTDARLFKGVRMLLSKAQSSWGYFPGCLRCASAPLQLLETSFLMIMLRPRKFLMIRRSFL